MSKYFFVSDKKSAKYIIKANVNNKLFKDNAVIVHAYPNKIGLLCYLHENALNLSDNTMSDNKRYVEKAKNEHFAKRFTIAINREKCKTPEDIANVNMKAINELLATLEKRAQTVASANKESANETKKTPAKKSSAKKATKETATA